MLRILLFIVLSQSISCKCKYTLTPEKLRSSCDFEFGINISKILVDSLDSDGIPYRFLHDTIIAYDPVCIYLTDDVKKVMGEDAANFDSCSFEPSNSLYFKKPNRNYSWYFKKPRNASIKYDTMPIEFQDNQWYEISNLYEDKGSPLHYIYFQIKNGVMHPRQVTRW